jgi:hypothetical protein
MIGRSRGSRHPGRHRAAGTARKVSNATSARVPSSTRRAIPEAAEPKLAFGTP